MSDFEAKNVPEWENDLAERLLKSARINEERRLTRVIDFHAQVIIAKETGIPIAVIWTDEEGTHIRGISDGLKHDWSGKNYLHGKTYIETLCQQIKAEGAAK